MALGCEGLRWDDEVVVQQPGEAQAVHHHVVLHDHRVRAAELLQKQWAHVGAIVGCATVWRSLRELRPSSHPGVRRSHVFTGTDLQFQVGDGHLKVIALVGRSLGQFVQGLGNRGLHGRVDFARGLNPGDVVCMLSKTDGMVVEDAVCSLRAGHGTVHF